MNILLKIYILYRRPAEVSVEGVDGPIGDAGVGWQRTPRVAEAPGVPVGGGRRISDVLIDRLADNSNRREYGMGFVGKLSGLVHII